MTYSNQIDTDAMTVRHVEDGEYTIIRSHPGAVGDGVIVHLPKRGETISASSLAWYERHGVRIDFAA
jgi:hypothetical protein